MFFSLLLTTGARGCGDEVVVVVEDEVEDVDAAEGDGAEGEGRMGKTGLDDGEEIGVFEVRDSTEKGRWGGDDVEEDSFGGGGGGRVGSFGRGSAEEVARDLRMGSAEAEAAVAADSLVDVVQSLETDLRPPSEWVGEMGNTFEIAGDTTEAGRVGIWGTEEGGGVAAATEAAAAAAAAAAAPGAMREVERSRGLSSSTLSISLLNRVCRRYWMAGSRKASSGRSGTKKQTSSVFGGRSLMASKTGSPVGPLAPTTLTASV